MLLSFTALVIISFVMIAAILTGLVNNHLYRRQINDEMHMLEKLAVDLSPLMAERSTGGLSAQLDAFAREQGGRLLVLDAYGKVQGDSHHTLYGTRIQATEVMEVLSASKRHAYGLHRLTSHSSIIPVADTQWVSYSAAPLADQDGSGGVLLFVSPITNLLAELDQVRNQMILAFLPIAAAALVAVLIISHLFSVPIQAITKTIHKMAKGDLSVRVQTKSSGEIQELANSYNAMAAKLETLDQARAQFVSNASHELKTPLTTMKVLLQTIMMDPNMPLEVRNEFMGDIEHEIDRLTSVVNDLLTLTRMDNQAGLTLSLEEARLDELVEDIMQKLVPVAEGRGQTLTWTLTPDVTMTLDTNKIVQVVYNLTENALKYTQDGGEIRVTLTRDAHNAYFRVQDNGVGIPEKDLPHIFDRFYRVDKARSRETGGTGLGLSIVWQLVQLHGGTVDVQSQYGKGSEFIMTLPLSGPETQEN